ncbi:uncharacterized protein C8A04DRAFT_28702 [Dichotomopilus funicola]|uniref:Uncharacterized protein n=1 Tax=Dichotomopilus funicola TaxID=1934379 RepID=A0AAN6ZNF7_9PEZI|nr:hypothetical protein C8A04DRAFT_28702 [Dichotomopilus funicola]
MSAPSRLLGQKAQRQENGHGPGVKTLKTNPPKKPSTGDGQSPDATGPPPLKTATNFVLAAAQLASQKATTATRAAATAAADALPHIPGTALVPPQDPVRKQQYLNLPSVVDHIPGLATPSETQFIASSIDSRCQSRSTSRSGSPGFNPNPRVKRATDKFGEITTQDLSKKDQGEQREREEARDGSGFSSAASQSKLGDASGREDM